MKTNIGYGNRRTEALCMHRTFFRLIMKLQLRQVCKTFFYLLYTALKQINNEDYVMLQSFECGLGSKMLCWFAHALQALA